MATRVRNMMLPAFAAAALQHDLPATEEHDGTREADDILDALRARRQAIVVNADGSTRSVTDDPRPAAANLSRLSDELAQCREQTNGSPCSRLRRMRLMEQLAAVRATLMEPKAASDLMEEATALYDGKKDNVAADGAHQLATYLIAARRYERAHAVISKALRLSLKPTRRHSLLFAQAAAFECQGKYLEAVTAVEHTFQGKKKKKGSSEFQLNYDHLKRWYELLRGYELQSGPLDSGAQAQKAAVLDGLMRQANTSGWDEQRWALPGRCAVGTASASSRPWYSHSDRLVGHRLSQDVLDLLRSRREPLLEEYTALKAAGKLHAPEGALASCEGYDWRRGNQDDAYTWWQYGVTSPHVPLDPLSQCSVETPIACGLLDVLRNEHDLRVLRLGYSAVTAGGHIRLHYGPTCGQLKVHLGLAVPRRGGRGRKRRCATLRVANETRGWDEGELTIFDDAFEHEVKNDCASERVVLQIVLASSKLWESSTSVG